MIIGVVKVQGSGIGPLMFCNCNCN